jgi:uncharacterized membrane protein YhaH (DUF805 family)
MSYEEIDRKGFWMTLLKVLAALFVYAGVTLLLFNTAKIFNISTSLITIGFTMTLSSILLVKALKS